MLQNPNEMKRENSKILDHIFIATTWRSGSCYLNKGECNLNQSKDDSFVEWVAKNNETMKQWRPPQNL